MAYTKQAKKHTGRGQKEQIVAELVEKLDNSNALVLADYQGLTHKQLEDLKRELKKLDATIVVTKNSLLKLSLGKSKNFADYKDNESLNRPTAALFVHADYTQPLKTLQKAIKNFGLPKIKLGILDGLVLDEAGVLKIASLPNRETLLTQLVGTLNSPIQGLVLTLNAPISQLAMVLNAISQTRPPATEAAGNVRQDKPSAPAPVSEPVQTETPTQVTEKPASTDQPTAEPVATEQTTELPLADVNDAMPEASESAATSDVATPASAEASAGEPASDETKPTKETKEEEQTSEGGEQTK